MKLFRPTYVLPDNDWTRPRRRDMTNRSLYLAAQDCPDQTISLNTLNDLSPRNTDEGKA